VLLLLSCVSYFNQAFAVSSTSTQNGRLVTFHDRGEEHVILTHAGTIRDALADAHITVDAADMIEPGLNQQLVATDYTVNIYRARPVMVIDGASRQRILTAAQTPSTIMQAAGMDMHDEDKAIVAASDDIVNDGAAVTLTVDRATEFTLNLYGAPQTTYSQAKTVGEMLNMKHIKLAVSDTLSVPSDAPLTAGMSVALFRNGTQTATVEEQIAFSTRQIQDVDQPAGYRQIQTAGTNGRKSVTYEITMQNGKEISRKIIQSITLEEPKQQIEVVGAKPSFSGDFAAALAKLRACESGGNYANKKNSLYRGAYQYSYSTWANYGGFYDPADAPPAVQDQAARNTYVRRGWQPWPNCGANLPDIYR